MGLFDTITCRIPLPVGGAEGWQTHDLDEGMSHYTIAADGMLSVSGVTWDEPVDVSRVSGPVEFCQYIGDVWVKDNWVEYRATFQAGRVVALHMTERGDEVFDPPVAVPLSYEAGT